MAHEKLVALNAREGSDLLHEEHGGVISQVQLRQQAGAVGLSVRAGATSNEG
eukprot:CAMPEP_0171959826 /NCGR_PEP_ID=MMETSP0993-20121228/151047_1 /TAXON_ID=483369 /ORGANISM="non described non described, Strain CCMP2098" /LENGTH=51 /DNA_ID=CAMNT_0012607437 /DNA_START=57 /DNA_END=210 /DNA_ORIENTATION=+